MPCLELFEKQEKAYQEDVLSNREITIAIEASRGFEWYKYAKEVIAMRGFGESGKGDELFEYFGFSAEHIVEIAKKL